MIVDRKVISAAYLLADKPGVTMIPQGFKVTVCPPRWATGSRRPLKGGRGDAPSINSPSTLIRSAYDKRAVTSYAAVSTINRKG